MVLACKTGFWRNWARTAALENIKDEMRKQKIINFYRNYYEKGKPYTEAHFAKIKVGRRSGKIMYLKQTSSEVFRGRIDGIKWRKKGILITANDRPYSTFC